MQLRPFPYQIIAYLENVTPDTRPLHCTLLRRFKLTEGMQIEDVSKELQEIIKDFPSIKITLGDKAKWSVDGSHYTVGPNKELAALKNKVDAAIKGKVSLRDPEYDSLDNLHVSFDTPHKQTLFRDLGSYEVKRISIQTDYLYDDSQVLK